MCAHYLSLDITQALYGEYLVANGRDNIGRRSAVGTVYIVPTRHTLFYSVISALSAALAAGSCFILEVWLYWMSKERETVTSGPGIARLCLTNEVEILVGKVIFILLFMP